MPLFNPFDPKRLLTCAQMAKADRYAVDHGTATEILMENAGRVVAEAALSRFRSSHILVLAGPGNNGGDGWVAARHLREAGAGVKVASLCPKSELGGAAAWAADAFTGDAVPFSIDALAGADLVIDALFGSGLTRPVEGVCAEMIAALNEKDKIKCLSIDIPSGIAGDSGEPLGTAVEADLTVTFFRKKPGHLLVPGRYHCGSTVVQDISIPADALRSLCSLYFYENHPSLWKSDWPVLKPDGHKYDRGHVLVLGGRVPALGAARLSAHAALRTGAGLVSLAAPEETYAIQAGALTDIMVVPFGRLEDFEQVISDRRKSVIALGPGGGTGAHMRDTVLCASRLGKTLVLDADALTAFEDCSDTLFAATGGTHTVMTPHMGEFLRLFPDLNGPDKLANVGAAAKRAGCVMLLKGADTICAAPDGEAVINASAPAHLATAGTGDVLTGIVAGLLAQKMPALAAAAAAVHIHGACAQRFGRGMIASDLLSVLPDILQELDKRL